MKVRFKNRDDFGRLESYQVIGFGLNLDNSEFYLIANDNFQIINLSLEIFEVIDSNLDDYKRRDELNYGRKFYLEKGLSQLHKTTESYAFLDNPKRNFKYFEEKKYPISEWYIKNVLNEEKKINEIQGFIACINIYIDRKFGKDHYREAFDFSKTDNLNHLIKDIIEEPIHFKTENYKDFFEDFIKNGLYDEEIGEEKSQGFVYALFKLIDDIFLREIMSVQRIQTFYDDCFIIEYENHFYILNKYWWG